MTIMNLLAGIFLLLAFFICAKSLLVDKKNLDAICSFYQKANCLDGLHMLKNERPYQKILNIVVDLGGFSWAVLFLMDFEKDSFIAVESVGLSLERFSSIKFDEINASGSEQDGMALSLKLLEHAFKKHEFRGALAGSAIEKNGVYYGCLLVGRDDSDAGLTETDNLRLNILSNQISISLHNYRMHKEIAFRAEQLAESQAQINKELTMAKMVQDNAIATEPPEFNGLQCATFVKPARFVGGDFLKFFPDDKGEEMGILIGDVCGKGVPAALIMSVVMCLFQEKMVNLKKPASLISAVNLSLKEFLGAGTGSRFNSSALYGLFNMKEKTFTYASAGHDFPLLYKASISQIVELQSTGTLLGIYQESDYKEICVKLDPGDKLIFYSDGLVDFFEFAQNVEDGFPVLEKFFFARKKSNPEEIVNEIRQLVETQNADQKDDITVAVISVD
jgi:sigma-B regulation protein RsbU (phosphoserine phosphatase)